MKTSMKIGLAAGALTMALSGGFFAGQATAQQEHMRSALDHLTAARDELSVAWHNKGGHRVRALEFTNRAIEQVRWGMEHADEW